MPRKFVYAPGLPGYGTRGVDGETGLLGLATYFSAYDGNSDSVTIKSKIIANKELFSNDVEIPGYPERVYQAGDIFIDKNARIFQIDFTESNLYKDTGIFLNTSGFFSEGPPQTVAPEFQRYSNAFETDKFLIDTVYTNSVGDYTQYPTTIYSNNPRYYARVDYIGEDVVVDLNGYYPFQVWSIGGLDPANNAVALSREENSNAWHFGNSNLGVIRDVSLYLDFSDIYCPSIRSGTGSLILYYNTATGRVTYGSSPSGMTMSNYNASGQIITSGGSNTNIVAQTNLTWISSILAYDDGGGGTFHIKTSNAVGSSDNPDYFKITTGNGAAGSSDDGTSGAFLSLVTGNGGAGAVGYYGGNGGDVSINIGSGNQAPGSFYPSGIGGNFIVQGGAGGDNIYNTIGTAVAGIGGGFLLVSGKGGRSQNFSGGSTGGRGGDINLYAADGGAATVTSGTGKGGHGGTIRLTAGDGGLCPTDEDGDGGDIFIDSGDGDSNGSIWLNYTSGNSTVIGGTVGGGLSVYNTANFNVWSGYTGINAQLRVFTGSASIPSVGFIANNDTGFYYATASLDEHIKITMDNATRFAFVNNNSTTQGDFYATGNIIAYGAIPSDVRLKKDVKLLQDSLEKVQKLNPVSYVRKSSGDTHLGLIAQEVEKIIPEVVRETMVLGEDESIKYKTINYDELVPVLIGAIKEQQKRIEALEEKINQLNN